MKSDSPPARTTRSSQRPVSGGWYDYNAGLWASDYIVSEVSENSMTWTSGSEVCIYTRCEAIPEDILSGTKAL